MSSTDTYTPTFVDNHGPRLSASLFEQDTWNQTSTSIDRVLSVNEDKVYISSPHGSDFGSTHTSSDEDYPQVEFTEEAAVITVRLPGMKQSKSMFPVFFPFLFLIALTLLPIFLPSFSLTLLPFKLYHPWWDINHQLWKHRLRPRPRPISLDLIFAAASASLNSTC